MFLAKVPGEGFYSGGGGSMSAFGADFVGFRRCFPESLAAEISGTLFGFFLGEGKGMLRPFFGGVLAPLEVSVSR